MTFELELEITHLEVLLSTRSFRSKTRALAHNPYNTYFEKVIISQVD
jgi:hypothetical protein